MTDKSKNPMTFYLPSGTTLNIPYDARLLAFEHDGMEIRHPFISDCARFSADPRDYGFVEVDTGGGCRALRKDLPSGDYLLLTDSDGQMLKDGDNTDEALLGRYNSEGEPKAYITMGDVPFSCDEDDAPRVMLVVIEGVEVQRAIDHVEVSSVSDCRGHRRGPSKAIPVLYDGEVMQETIDGKIHILRR
ncbi:hypothetical protein HOV23_gp088 [Pseudomonas phage Lana]|uniref:Uncharacterized protein n=1 Tax=Pseudomonas phage Lana TaxID=2530172 RepID=A0A481W688_9CAUD|nr:hypothetical protein HOV23_gp088 [Pseudomonas phage Lana]QBJ04485.1 hypothetical protein [Pseudomonas phage Lana]